mgnify:CR=1 FL=1
MSDTIKTVLVDGGSPVALTDNEETRFIYNLLPVGKFFDKRYGELEISEAKIKQMAENFGKYPSYEVPVKIGHSDGAKSPGKVIAATAKPEGLEITMLVDTETAEAINNKQYRYMSAEFDDDYYDKTTGQKAGAVLLGAALVNQPGHPYVAPLKLVDDIPNEEGRNNKDMTELEELQLKYSDLKVQLQNAQDDAEATAKKLSDLEASNKALIEERERAENARNEAEVKAFCDKWTGKGIPPAVLEKIRPLLTAKQSRVIRLSDDAKDDVPSLKFFDDLLEGLPKMPMKQVSTNDTAQVELSDVEKAIAHGKAIAGIKD